MRILLLGGTVFLSYETARQALERGHEVTCVARGAQSSPPDGAEFVTADRDSPDGLAALSDRTFDAVIDVARQPRHVKWALASLAGRVGHWTFVSTISVYADDRTVGQRADTAPIVDPLAADAGPEAEADPANYPGAKVACERAVLEGIDGALIARAGLIVGPGDRSDRFTYWPVRIADGGEVLAPGTPDDPVQFVDVRDLAAWLLDGAESRRSGIFDATGPVGKRGDVLKEIAQGVGAEDVTFTWADQEFLRAQNIEYWMGPRSLPLWLPLPDDAGGMSRDVSTAKLRTRPIADTARATLDWVRGTDHVVERSGISREVEAEALEAWHNRAS